MQGQYTPLQIERFWSKVDKNGPIPAHCPELGPCWLWVGNRTKQNYGIVAIDKKRYPTHRVSYQMAHGPLASGLFVRHRCNNPPCCNPAHLIEGTPLDNMRDRIETGAGYAMGDDHWTHQRPVPTRGEKNGFHKLTEEKVREMRRIYAAGEANTYELGEMFGVHQGVAWRIIRRKSWAHVT